MKRLVLLGEGHGEVSALPILARRLVQEKGADDVLFVDHQVVRSHDAASLIRCPRGANACQCDVWLRHLAVAARRQDVGGVLAIFDGDAKSFPAGSGTAFCAKTAAQLMASKAREVGAGATFSLAIVFACVEFETWLVAGIESLSRCATGNRFAAKGLVFPAGDPETHGKGWLQAHMPSYNPARDQADLTRQIDLNEVRQRDLRSFRRLEHALDQLIAATRTSTCVCAP